MISFGVVSFWPHVISWCNPFQDRFCASRKGGTGEGGWVYHSGWQCMVAIAAACRKAWPMLGGPFVYLLAQTGVENAPFTLYGLHLWHFRQLLVRRSVFYLESPDYWTLPNEWMWPRSHTYRDCANKALAQVSSASSQQKWKYGPRKVSVALTKTFSKWPMVVRVNHLISLLPSCALY